MGIKIVDLLWLDIQGMELDVMKASQDTMQKSVKFLHSSSNNNIFKFYEGNFIGIRSKNYTQEFINSIKKINPSHSHDLITFIKILLSFNN